MKYIGKFRDKKDTLHTITITTKVGTGTTNMVLCTSPFVEELEGDGNTIFKPCKYSSATVRVLAKDYMWDIFQSKAQDVSVVLTDELGNVEWTGYVTPNMYDMGYESDKEELEIECIDALSSLQYYKYVCVDEKPKTKSFLDIIRNILSSRTPYQYMYFPSFLEGITLDKLKICEQNFLGEENEDVWTMQEVLEEICRYLNVTCVACGSNVYFINYSALEQTEYMKYGIQNDDMEETLPEETVASVWGQEDTKIFSKSYPYTWHILCSLDESADGEMKMYVKHTDNRIWQEVKFFVHYGNGEGYIIIDEENKGEITNGYCDRLSIVRGSDGQAYIQWRCNIYRNDYTNATLITSCVGNGVHRLPYYMAGKLLSQWDYYSLTDTTPEQTSEGDESYVSLKDYASHFDNFYIVDKDAYSDGGGTISLLPSYNQVSVVSKINEYKDLIPDVFEERYLSNANGDWNQVHTYILNGSSYNATTGVLGRYRFVTNPHYKTYYYDKESGEQVNMDTCRQYPELQNYVGATLVQASFEEYNKVNFDTIFASKGNKTLTDYILIHQHDRQAGKLVFSTVASEIPETYIGKNTKIVIKGSIRCMDRDGWMYIPTNYGNRDDDFSRMNLYLECKLKWGDYYYFNYDRQGIRDLIYRPGRWVKSETTFRLYFNAPDTSHINNKDYSVLDTSGDYGLTDIPSGYVIPLPELATVQGSIPEFSIYTRGRVDEDYRMDAIWLKDFSIQLALPKDSNIKDDEWETDTLYTNVINEEYVEEGDEIECKINTWDNKAPTYSVVMYSDGNTQNYLDTVTNLATGKTYRLEEHIIYDFVNQYKQPSIQLDISVKDRLKPFSVVNVPYISNGKNFIVDSYSRDYYSCNNNVKLVEIWNL